MRRAQVVRVRLGIGGQRPENCCGLGVCVSQRRDGRRRAGRPRATPGLHFWHASRPGRPGPSPQTMCRVVSGDPGRRTLVPCPTRPAVPPRAATRPTCPAPGRGTRLRRAGRRDGALLSDDDATAGEGACGDDWCRPSCRCT
jgi:hypothetical protein